MRWSALLLCACSPDVIVQNKPDDPLEPADTDAALGLGGPDLEVEPAELSFGALPPGCPAEDQVLTLRNVGDTELVVDEVVLGGPGKAGYALRGRPRALAPGEEARVTVGFEAARIQSYEPARVEVRSNDPDEPTKRVPLHGEGSEFAFQVDRFEQEEGGGVDVLFSIDHSGSMDEELDALTRTFDVFIRSFVNLGLDYHIGVITTDPGCPQLLGPVIDAANPDPVAEFARQTALGGCGGEAAFGASKNALTSPAVDVSPNKDFLRPNATLAVVAVSDEPEDSGMTAAQYVRWLQSLKPDPAMVSFSGIVPPDSGFGCLAAPLPAPSYGAAIRQSGGVYGSICTLNMRPFLQHLSYVAAGLEYRFPLSRQPTSTSPTAVTVTVDGAAVPFSITDGWQYDGGSNSIELYGGAIPDPGQRIEVRYPYDADCG